MFGVNARGRPYVSADKGGLYFRQQLTSRDSREISGEGTIEPSTAMAAAFFLCMALFLAMCAAVVGFVVWVMLRS